MKKYAQHWLWGIIAFWIVMLGYLILPQEIQVNYPADYPRVLLKAYPVDPQDLLRGDYVILSYAFSQPNTEFLSPEFNREFEDILDSSTSGDKVYLMLETDDKGNAVPVKYVRKKPTDGLFLKGKIYADYRGRNAEVRFGIEKYFVPEGTGRELEKAKNMGDLEVEVAIHPKKGKALITGVFVTGERSDNVHSDSDSTTSFSDLSYSSKTDLVETLPKDYDFLTKTVREDQFPKEEDDYSFVAQSDGTTLLFKKGNEVLETISLDEFYRSLPLDKEDQKFADENITFDYEGKKVRLQLIFTGISANVDWTAEKPEALVSNFDGNVFFSVLEDLEEE